MKRVPVNKINTEKLVAALESGAVLVLPTDTVYGLVCDAGNEKAVERIFEIKKRNKTKPLAVFVKDIESAKDLAVISEKEAEYLKDNKTTVILQAKKIEDGPLSKLIYRENTIGIRIPKYKFLNDLLEKVNKPLVQTSANISNQPALTKINEIIEQFKDEDVLVIDAGDLPNNKPSKIADLTRGDHVTIRY